MKKHNLQIKAINKADMYQPVVEIMADLDNPDVLVLDTKTNKFYNKDKSIAINDLDIYNNKYFILFEVFDEEIDGELKSIQNRLD